MAAGITNTAPLPFKIFRPMTDISLQIFKKHVYADDSTIDDEYLDFLLSAAKTWVFGHINATADEICAEHGGELPHDLVAAILAIGGEMYHNREATVSSSCAASLTLQGVLNRYRKFKAKRR